MGRLYRVSVKIQKAWICFLMAILVPVVCIAQDQASPPPSPTSDTPAETSGRLAILLDVQGPIGPATSEYLVASLDKAAKRDTELVIIRMDTPGGLDASMRDIIKAILDSPVPVATFVTPGGARAASAGMYILLASHVAAMSPATNVGAATPVSILGGEQPTRNPQPGEEGDDSKPDEAGASSAMERKAVNDAVAYARGLADRHGRNADWAEEAVRDAASITAEKALETGVIDLMAADVSDLLRQLDGRTVKVRDRDWTLHTSGLQIERLEPGWKSELLGVITSPTIAYLLLLVGIYGLFFEGYNPGAVLPGVIGAICLLIALYAFQMLPVNYAGFALLALGIILIIAEAAAPSFGVLGIGGIISLVIGSVILIDTDVPGFAISRPLIGGLALAGSLGLFAIIGIAVKARLRPVVSGREQLIGAAGTALADFHGAGEVFVHSERWSAVTETPLRKGQDIVVTGIEGLVLKVRPADR
jgi:membrane-bound serine protease (ClpP class)